MADKVQKNCSSAESSGTQRTTPKECSLPKAQLAPSFETTGDSKTESNKETQERNSLEEERFTVWHLNVRGWKSKSAEITALLRLEPKKPELVCLTESFLDKSTKNVSLEGYTEVARHDRKDNSA